MSTPQLNHISVSPNNHFFSVLNDSFLVGRSDSNNIKNFDVLLFCRRDITTAIIPSFIRIISPYAFNNCYLMKAIEFQENSQLAIIQKYAFSSASIERIDIPSNVTKIEESAFVDCATLDSIEFESDSKLKRIEKYAFRNISLVFLSIPSNVEFIGDCAFCSSAKLKSIEFLGEVLTLGHSIFDCSCISLISFPNASEIENFGIFLFGFQGNVIVFVPSSTILN